MIPIICTYILNLPSALVKMFLNSTDLMDGYKAAESVNDEQWKIQQKSLLAQCEAVADMKFTYVVSCQQYGNDKRAALSNAQDILQIMRT
jgi:callose synthase